MNAVWEILRSFARYSALEIGGTVLVCPTWANFRKVSNLPSLSVYRERFPMKNNRIYVLVGIIVLGVGFLAAPAQSREQDSTLGNDILESVSNLFLPIVYNGGGSTPATTATPTFVPTAPTDTPTATAMPTGISTATATPTASHTATATQTPTGTATPIGTATPTSTAPLTPIPTSIPFPDLTFSCAAEPTTNNSRLLKITVQPVSPAPAAASFTWEPTQLAGPIDNILQPGPFQLVNIFTGQSSATSPGALTKCDTQNTCTVTYTLTETNVTRYLGATVTCQF